MLVASLRLFNWRILKGEARGVEIRGRELAADLGPRGIRIKSGRESEEVGDEDFADVYFRGICLVGSGSKV